MRKIWLFTLIIFCAIQLQAQRSSNAKLEDSVFTWGPLQALKPEKYPRTFTPEQKKLPELFYQWLRKSYTLLGAINTDKSMAIAEPNEKDEAIPYIVGLFAPTYMPEWDKAGTKVVRQPHSENPIIITTNHIIDAQPIPMLTIKGRAVFMRRSADIENTFNKPYLKNLIKDFKLQQHPQIGKYLIQYYGCEGDLCQPSVAVYLTPNNRLPIRQLTRGEVLNMVEQAVPAEAEKARKKIISENSYRKDQQEKWLKNFEENTLHRWKTNIEKLKNKYAGQLNAPAEIRNPNGIEIINFFNGDDIFEKSYSNTFGVYTYEDGVFEKSKQDKPLWVCISWSPANQDRQFQNRELHRSMTTHFNFDYVYDYFYNPQKVKGIAYTMLNPDAQKLTTIKANENKKTTAPGATLPAGVVFLDDFSQSNVGTFPQGWFSVNMGTRATVTALNDTKGNWVELAQYEFKPNLNHFKTPMPLNFSFEFDVAVSNFSTSSGGALQLRINNYILGKDGTFLPEHSTKQKDIEFLIRSGNAKQSDQANGYSSIKATYSGMPTQLRYAAELQYNNDLSNIKNKAHIKITKQGNTVKAFINGNEIIALDKYKKTIAGYNELPEGSKFTSFYFLNKTEGKENKVYISNIKITAL